MKRTALITYHAAHNNGSFLQAFATQRMIQKLGHECDIIDFSTPRQQYLYDVYKKVSGPKDVLKNLYALMHYGVIRQRHDDFTALIHSALKLTPKFYEDVSELVELNNQYDVFISGSDQIWNMDAWDYSDAYCLSFVTSKPKISYASSMGGHILQKRDDQVLADRYRKLLSGYWAISVREQSAKEYLAEILSRPITQVIDPTLMLDPDDYSMITAPRLVDEPYIFYYAIDSIELNESAALAVKAYAEAQHMPVYVMFTGNKSYGLKKFGFHMIDGAAANHYLSLIWHADHVLTASFHGTAFSILFNKQFHVVRGKKNGKVNMDDRMSSLLKVCGLESQQLIEGQPWTDDEIDYTSVKPRLDAEKQRCTEFLTNAIG